MLTHRFIQWYKKYIRKLNEKLKNGGELTPLEQMVPLPPKEIDK